MSNEIQLIKDTVNILLNYTPGRDYVVNKADESSVEISIQNSSLSEKYGEKLVYRGGIVKLILPIFIFDKSIIQLYDSILSRVKEIKTFKPMVYVHDCDGMTLGNIKLYNVLRSEFNLNVKESVEISIVLNKLITASRKAREYRSRELSEEEYIDYQHVMDDINKCIKALEKLLPDDKILKVVDRAIEVLENQSMKPGELEKAINEVLGVSSFEKISEVLGGCPRDIYETYAKLSQRLGGKHIIIIPDYLRHLAEIDMAWSRYVIIEKC